MFEVAIASMNLATLERVVHWTCCQPEHALANDGALFSFCGADVSGGDLVIAPVDCAECVRVVAWNPGCSACPRRWAPGSPE